MSDTLIYSREINIKNMLVFTVPTMVRMIFVSMYSIVDGIVVSNYVGSLGLSAINIVYPVLNVCMALAFMMAAGSSAIIGKKLGEGRTHEANRFMSLSVILTVSGIIALAVIFLQFDEQIYMMLGSDEEMLPYCIEYGTIMVAGGPLWALQVIFQSYLVTADRPRLGLGLSICAGLLNIVLDILLVGVLGWGMQGAAIASVAGMIIAGTVPLTIFFSKKSVIYFERPEWNGNEVLKSLGNGSSEMVSNLASAITTTLFNLQMMELIGEKGVAAISAILYLQFIFVAIFFGFASGIAPVISYNYGAENKDNIKKLFNISAKIVAAFSLSMFIIAEVLNRPLSMIFASQDPILLELMVYGFRIIAISVLFSGITIFSSGFFTALNNGKISAVISMLRTFVLEVGALLLLPVFMGIDGVWWALPIAEILAALVAVYMLMKYRKVYGY